MDDCGGHHRESSSEEAESDLANGGKVDSGATEGGVDGEIGDGDKDDESEGVEVVEDIVGETMGVEHGGLRGQVVENLVLRASEVSESSTCLEVDERR